MCILCVASRWSRHIAATVMPMVTIWALSQFLPQRFRFEITSPKLACVGVLFVSLSWCELVMPRLSAWRARRAAALKERRRVEAQEAAKRRKKATRRCRNCFTAYKDQTSGGGRFMCTYCGHVSKRPVLDLPVGASSAGSSFSLSGSAVEFLNGNGFFTVRSPKYWYDRALFVRPSWGSGRSWIGVGPWIDGANWGMSASWFGGSWPGSALYFDYTGFGWPGSGTLLGDGVFGGERWFAGESYFGVFWFLIRVFSQLLVFAVWIWRKVSRAEYAEENEMDEGHEVCHTRDEDGGSSPETKGKKSRRKAEEKRLARLEKEQQEAEEKKQREEVAKLVEERRRQKDKKLETEKKNARAAGANLGKEMEVEKELERRKEKSRGKEKVLAKENFKNQGIEELTKKTNFAAPKSIKTTKNTGVKDKELNVKSSSNFFSKWGAFKSRGSAKSGLFSQSKKAAAPTKTSMSISTDLNPSVKPIKAVIPNASESSSASSSSTKSSCADVSGSVWTQTAWSNVLCHGAMEVSDHNAKKLDMVERANTNSGDANRDLIHDLNEASFMGRFSQQQDKASSYSDQRDYPFADSLCLPLVDLPNFSFTDQGLNKSGSKVHHMPISTSSSLCINGSPASMTTPSAQYSMSSTWVDSFEASTSAPISNVLSSLLLSNSTGRLAHNSLCLVGPASDCLTASVLGTESNSLVPLGVASLPSSRILQSTKADRRDPCQSWEPWSMSAANSLNCQMSQDNWNHCSSTYVSQINTLPQPTLEASFQQREDFEQTNVEPEFYLPSSLFSFEEIDSRRCSCQNLMPDKNNCLDLSGMESIMCDWEDMDVYHRVPPEFVDCITHSLMQDPVITADGHSYERSAIEDWLKLHDTSPKTGEVLPPPPGGNGVDKTLRPNHILRCQIIEFRERLTRRFGSHEGLKNSFPSASARSGVFWPTKGSTTTKPPLNSFLPPQGVESVWSCGMSGG